MKGLQMLLRVLLFVMAFSPLSLLAAEPLVKVPNLPSNSELELYEDSEGLFTLKVLEFYKSAVVLETQIKLSGAEPVLNVEAPTFEELEDMEVKTIKKFHKTAQSLESQVQGLPDSERQILLENINELESRLRDTVAVYTIEAGKLRNEMLDLMLSRLQEIEETNKDNIDLVIQQNYLNCRDYNSWLSVSGISKIFFSNGNDVLTNDPGLGAAINLNIGDIVGFSKAFQVRYEYLAPRFFTEYKSLSDMGIIPREQWNTNVNSLSAGGKVDIGKNDNIVHGFEFYLGYFWADGKIYNRSDSRMNWDGALFSVDYFIAAPSCRMPLELFAGLSVYNSFSRSLIFHTAVGGYEVNDLGRTHLSVNLGLRYHIWRTPF